MPRLAKYIAECGVTSRRDAEKMILSGRVMVGGLPPSSIGMSVGDEDEVTVDGVKIHKTEELRVWLYYKPVGIITTHKDPQKRPTVFEQLSLKMPRVISVGRLDINSEGLLILTNSGEFARKMELPSSSMQRVYKVRAYNTKGAQTNEKGLIESSKTGVLVDGIKLQPQKIQRLQDETNNDPKNKWYLVTLVSGKNREVRKIFTHFGFSVNRLIRISYGKYSLGDLKPGEYKEVKF